MKRSLTLFVVVCCCAVLVTVTCYERTNDLVQDAIQLGNTEQPLDSAAIWWRAAATCLQEDTALPTPLRIFSGGSLPPSWKKTWDRGQLHGGYATRGELAWVERMNKAIVTHEIWHLGHGDGHPPEVFGADAKQPRCGLAPGAL